jgi:K+-transporting ATPase KdpF subunit
MKNNNLAQFTTICRDKFSKNPLAISLFFALCFNLLFASTLYGATGEAIARNTAYALGILLLVTLGLSVYLFIVIFQPERF